VRRISLAFRSFFALLFHGALSEKLIGDLGLSSRPAPPPAPVRSPDAALQILGILQRDSRLIDFIMEDVSGYSDDQVGAAVRGLHDQARESLGRYVKLEPVIDSVEGTYAKAAGLDAASVKFIGNVPAGTPAGGTLRHKGWRAARVDLPAAGKTAQIIAPAEIEIE
jgi:hypothetical protein